MHEVATNSSGEKYRDKNSAPWPRPTERCAFHGSRDSEFVRAARPASESGRQGRVSLEQTAGETQARGQASNGASRRLIIFVFVLVFIAVFLVLVIIVEVVFVIEVVFVVEVFLVLEIFVFVVEFVFIVELIVEVFEIFDFFIEVFAVFLVLVFDFILVAVLFEIFLVVIGAAAGTTRGVDQIAGSGGPEGRSRQTRQDGFQQVGQAGSGHRSHPLERSRSESWPAQCRRRVFLESRSTPQGTAREWQKEYYTGAAIVKRGVWRKSERRGGFQSRALPGL